MPERFPPIEPVQARGAFASEAGGRSHSAERVTFVADGSAAFAFAVRGISHTRNGKEAADRVADLCLRIFRERTSSMLDDLAEVWWRAEHGAAEGVVVRPFSSLPIADRSELRARVRKLLAERIPDALGDQAVLEAETSRLLDLPAAALRRAGSDLERIAERDKRWAGSSAAASTAIFAAGHASIAHIGDGRVVRLRGGRLEPLTREHTLASLYEDGSGPEVRDDIPAGVVVRVLGMPGNPANVDVVRVPLERGDRFLLATAGFTARHDAAAVRAALAKDGIQAAPLLVAAGAPASEANLAAVAVEIL